jgi:N-acyl-D-aspartate/D-glutamate deacylase
METLLLANGSLVDGTGAPPVRGDVLVRGDRILQVGKVTTGGDCRRIDCTGLVVAPGFIDNTATPICKCWQTAARSPTRA